MTSSTPELEDTTTDASPHGHLPDWMAEAATAMVARADAMVTRPRLNGGLDPEAIRVLYRKTKLQTMQIWCLARDGRDSSAKVSSDKGVLFKQMYPVLCEYMEKLGERLKKNNATAKAAGIKALATGVQVHPCKHFRTQTISHTFAHTPLQLPFLAYNRVVTNEAGPKSAKTGRQSSGHSSLVLYYRSGRCQMIATCPWWTGETITKVAVKMQLMLCVVRHSHWWVACPHPWFMTAAD